MNRTRITLAGLILSLSFLPGCGDESEQDEIDPRDRCTSEIRFSTAGSIGPNRFEILQADPFAGLLDDDFFNVNLETGEGSHLIVFTTNRLVNDTTLKSALDQRMRGGAADAETLEVVSRPNEIPCDPREGAICASFGVDTNLDGSLFGAAEVIYPAGAGSSITFSQVTGNELAATYLINFDPMTSGDEEGGDETGGSISGCFRYSISSDRNHID